MEEDRYLTAEDLAKRLHYHPRYVRDHLVPRVFKEGIHYFRPFGRRRVLFIWDAIERDMMTPVKMSKKVSIPMASGGVCHG